MEVLAIPVPGLARVQRSHVAAAPQRMEVVDGEVRMVPIEQGVIEPNLEPGGAHRLDKRPDQVLAVGRRRHGVVGQR